MAHYQPALIRRHRALGIGLGISLLLAGCEPTDQGPANQPSAQTPLTEEQASALTTPAGLVFWGQANQQLQQCRELGDQLQQQIQQLLLSPDQAQLDSTRSAWSALHNCTLSLAPLFALAAVSPGLFGDLVHAQYALDANPILPGYLDAVEGYPFSGLVNDISVNLTAQNLRQQQGLTDLEDVVLGLHAMAYLLWGENGQQSPQALASSTNTTADLKVHELPANRRRTLLSLQMQLWLDDLGVLQRAMQPNQVLTLNYYALPENSRQQLLQAVFLYQLNTLEAAYLESSDESSDIEGPDQEANEGSINLEGVQADSEESPTSQSLAWQSHTLQQQQWMLTSLDQWILTPINADWTHASRPYIEQLRSSLTSGQSHQLPTIIDDLKLTLSEFDQAR